MTMLKEATFYTTIGTNVKCNLCPHSCTIKEDQLGLCKSRSNRGGKLYALTYGKVSSMGLDPIEKKPLYHYYPGTMILSVGGLWCNLDCKFCQNWKIAHKEAKTIDVSPEKLCEIALENDSIGIAFTYNEPSIWFEYICDAARIARRNNLKIVLVTNGYILSNPLKDLLSYVDAMNIDLKSFRDNFYKDYCGGRLEFVKRTIEESVKHCHVEVTNLIIGGLNDSDHEMEELSGWLSSLNSYTPLHISRYFPAYKMNVQQTPVETFFRLRDLAAKHLKYVYIGNVNFEDCSTKCPSCGTLAVNRLSKIEVLCTADGYCSKCGFKVFNTQKCTFENYNQ